MISCVQVWCDLDSPDGPWIVFLRRFNGSTDFDRTFQEYSDGFGTAAGEYWLGKFSFKEIMCDKIQNESQETQFYIDNLAFISIILFKFLIMVMAVFY